MLIVLNVRYSLIQITIGTNARSIKAILDFAQKLFNNGNSIFTDDNSFHLKIFNLAVPVMTSYICNCKSFCWISI